MPQKPINSQIPHKIFILVGGLGTRLKEIVSDVPKPMADINGKPFLYYKILQFKKMGFKHLVFCTGHLSHIIEDYFGDGSLLDLHIEYSYEEERLGTAGAIKNAQSFTDGPFFMANGDTYLNFDPKPMLDFVNKQKIKNCMLLTTPHEKGQEGVVTMDENSNIISFKEKPKGSSKKGYINAGIYYLSPETLDLIPENQKISIEEEIFPKLISNPNMSIYGFNYEGYFIDIGLPKNYLTFCDDIINNKLEF